LQTWELNVQVTRQDPVPTVVDGSIECRYTVSREGSSRLRVPGVKEEADVNAIETELRLNRRARLANAIHKILRFKQSRFRHPGHDVTVVDYGVALLPHWVGCRPWLPQVPRVNWGVFGIEENDIIICSVIFVCELDRLPNLSRAICLRIRDQGRRNFLKRDDGNVVLASRDNHCPHATKWRLQHRRLSVVQGSGVHVPGCYAESNTRRARWSTDR
jgi:hypothetical protein